MRFPLVLLASVLATACADPPEDVDDDAAEAHRTTVAWALVEREAPRDGELRTNFAVKFVRVSPTDVEGARALVGVRPTTPALGECVPLASLEPSAQSPRPGFAAELVDVGEVHVEVGGEPALQLVPRAFPDIGDWVSGVFYTSPDVDSDLPLPGRYIIGASAPQPGRAREDGLTITVDAPDAPDALTVEGHGLAELPPVPAGKDVTLGWSVLPDAARDARDLVYIDVRGEAGAQPGATQPGAVAVGATRCAFADGGAAILPRELFPAGAEGQSVVLSLHRLSERAGQIQTGGDESALEGATVVFDLAQSFRLSLASASE